MNRTALFRRGTRSELPIPHSIVLLQQFMPFLHSGLRLPRSSYQIACLDGVDDFDVGR